MMKYPLFVISCFIILFISASPVLPQEKENLQSYINPNPYSVENVKNVSKKDKTKNVILMVGDGMSLSIMYTAWTANRGKLNIENCEYTGLSKTYSASDLITDSGAGATAFATGNKTNNHSVGVDANNKAVKSLAALATERKMSTGLIATCNILDATPAAFVAHTNNRDNWDDIALAYTTSKVDFVCGGGFDSFKKGKNGKDLTKVLAADGYQLPENINDLEKIKTGKVFALLAPDNLPVPSERGDVLSRSAMKAIDLLNKNDNGFFLMIEGSMIDDQAHGNKLNLMIDEALDFDRAAGAVLKWAASDGETLIVILADHETGGWTLLGGNKATGEVTGKFSTDGHSGVMVPVYSFGPGSEKFTGIFENTEVFKKILNTFKGN